MKTLNLKQPNDNHLKENCHTCGWNAYIMHSSIMHKGKRIYFCNKMCELKSELTDLKGLTNHDF